MATELEKRLAAEASIGPRNMSAEGRKEWKATIPKLAKGEGFYGAHGAQKIVARHFKETYGLTCCLRSVQNAIQEDMAKWRAEHGE